MEGEEVFDAGAFGVEGGGAVGAVEGGMGLGEAGGHRDGAVQVRQRRALSQMLRPLVEDGLGEALDLRAAYHYMNFLVNQSRTAF